MIETEMTDPDILKDSGADFLFVVVDPKDVERSDVDPTARTLRRLLQDRETVLRFRGRLDLSFAGYDEDPRELFEIAEVRNFLAELDTNFPFWFYFLNLRSGSLALVLFSLCSYSTGPDGMVVLDAEGRARFLAEHYLAVNWLFSTYGLDEKDNDALTLQVSGYFEKLKQPPTIH